MNEKAFYNNIEKYIVIVLFIIMTAITGFNVISRFIFNFTLSWGEQLVRLMLVWISFAGISWAGAINAHMRVTAISLVTGKKHENVFQVILFIGDVITAIFAFWASYRICRFMIMIAQQDQRLSAMPWIPKWVMYLAGVLGMAGYGIRVIQKRYIWFKQIKGGSSK